MLLKGKIIKLLGGFYYVQTKEGKVEETRARGLFRHQDKKPLVGDDVIFSYAEGQELSYIEEILERKNFIIRPPIANVDQILIFVPVKSPKYNLFLIDKLIAYYESLHIDILLVVSKSDLNQGDGHIIMKDYRKAGFKSYMISDKEDLDFENLKKDLENKTSALAGVSGAGKSSFTNRLLGKEIETAAVSKKTDRGRHTTRHTEIIGGPGGIFLFDTPGFSSLDLAEIESLELRYLFREFLPFMEKCFFQDCNHINQMQCGVLDALDHGKILPSRYANYVKIYEELTKKEKGKWR